MAHPIVYGPADRSYVWSARLAPAERGVTHELVDVPFGPHREQTHLSRQPFAKLPAFEHGGFMLYETQAIVRYVDERFPGVPLLPEDVHVNNAAGNVRSKQQPVTRPSRISLLSGRPGCSW